MKSSVCLDLNKKLVGTVYIAESGHLQVDTAGTLHFRNTSNWCKTEKRSRSQIK